MSVDINVGDDWQAKVTANVAGTTFIVKTGTHARPKVLTHKANNVFQFEGGVICDGQNLEPYFMRSGGVSGVQLIGNQATPPIIKQYRGQTESQAVIWIAGGEPGNAKNWLLQDLDVGPNGWFTNQGGMGVRLGDGAVARRVNSHDNDQYGFGSGGGNTTIILLEDCISENNGGPNDGGDRGGSKFVSDHVHLLRSHAISNRGVGWWWDTGTDDFRAECSHAIDNDRQGFHVEVPRKGSSSPVSGLLTQCYTSGNGFVANRSLMYDAGIVAGHAEGVEIDRCVSYNDYKGIGGNQQYRCEKGTTGSDLISCVDAVDPSAPARLLRLRNLYVHDCKVYVLGGAGIAAGLGVGDTQAGDPYSAAANNRFENNDYWVVNTVGSPFAWQGSKTWSQWRALGHDLTGSFTSFAPGNAPADPGDPCGAAPPPPPPPTEPPAPPIDSGPIPASARVSASIVVPVAARY